MSCLSIKLKENWNRVLESAFLLVVMLAPFLPLRRYAAVQDCRFLLQQRTQHKKWSIVTLRKNHKLWTTKHMMVKAFL